MRDLLGVWLIYFIHVYQLMRFTNISINPLIFHSFKNSLFLAINILQSSCLICILNFYTGQIILKNIGAKCISGSLIPQILFLNTGKYYCGKMDISTLTTASTVDQYQFNMSEGISEEAKLVIRAALYKVYKETCASTLDQSCKTMQKYLLDLEQGRWQHEMHTFARQEIILVESGGRQIQIRILIEPIEARRQYDLRIEEKAKTFTRAFSVEKEQFEQSVRLWNRQRQQRLVQCQDLDRQIQSRRQQTKDLQDEVDFLTSRIQQGKIMYQELLNKVMERQEDYMRLQQNIRISRARYQNEISQFRNMFEFKQSIHRKQLQKLQQRISEKNDHNNQLKQEEEFLRRQLEILNNNYKIRQQRQQQLEIAIQTKTQELLMQQQVFLRDLEQRGSLKIQKIEEIIRQNEIDIRQLFAQKRSLAQLVVDRAHQQARVIVQRAQEQKNHIEDDARDLKRRMRQQADRLIEQANNQLSQSQRNAEVIMGDARREADLMIRQARLDAERIVEEALRARRH